MSADENVCKYSYCELQASIPDVGNPGQFKTFVFSSAAEVTAYWSELEYYANTSSTKSVYDHDDNNEKSQFPAILKIRNGALLSYTGDDPP